MSLVPPSNVAKEAEKALELRKEFGRGGTLVGVARARDLANRKELSPDTIKRMVSFFARHEVDKKGKGFYSGDEGYPSAGKIAWGLWGGDPGRAWAEKMLRQIERNEGVTEMIDVNVLTGADIRRIDGKYGKIKKVSMPWVTVRWDNGVEESYLRSSESLAEDVEIKTLDKGWIALGSVVGLSEKVAPEASDDEGMEDEEDDEEEMDDEEDDTEEEDEEDEEEDDEDMEESASSFGDILESIRGMLDPPRRLHESTERWKQKAIVEAAKASAKAKSLLKSKKSAAAAPAAAPAKKAAPKKQKKGKKASKKKTGGNPSNPFVNFSTLGTHTKANVERSAKGIWKCKGSEWLQICTAQVDVPDQGIKKGTKKKIKISKAWKKTYMQDYAKSRAAGTTQDPAGNKVPVKFSRYNLRFAKYGVIKKKAKKKKAAKTTP